MITKAEKQAIKGYRLWAVMQAEDTARCEYEVRMQACLGLANQHVLALHQRGYYTCTGAVKEAAEELKLY